MRPFIDNYPLNSGRLAAAPVFADYIESLRLSPNTQLNVAIPAGARFVLFSFTGDVRVRVGTAATILSDEETTTDGTGGELNPSARRIPDRLADGATVPTHVNLRATSAVDGSLSFYG